MVTQIIVSSSDDETFPFCELLSTYTSLSPTSGEQKICIPFSSHVIVKVLDFLEWLSIHENIVYCESAKKDFHRDFLDMNTSFAVELYKFACQFDVRKLKELIKADFMDFVKSHSEPTVLKYFSMCSSLQEVINLVNC
ncbi:hypothetical protein P9112_003396 [Eukaryota sp. TZLM1-RC]